MCQESCMVNINFFRMKEWLTVLLPPNQTFREAFVQPVCGKLSPVLGIMELFGLEGAFQGHRVQTHHVVSVSYWGQKWAWPLCNHKNINVKNSLLHSPWILYKLRRKPGRFAIKLMWPKSSYSSVVICYSQSFKKML